MEFMDEVSHGGCAAKITSKKSMEEDSWMKEVVVVENEQRKWICHSMQFNVFTMHLFKIVFVYNVKVKLN